MPNRFKEIPVVDGHGDQLTLYEISERGPLFGLIPRTRFELGTGEAVEAEGDDFVIAATGEKLTRVGRDA